MGPIARRVYAGVSGGSVRRRVRHAVVRLWAGGVAQERPRAAAAQEHAVRVPYGSCGAASSATSAGQPTVCVCAPHSPAHFAGCAAREAGAGSGGCGREGSPHATLRRRRWATACAAPCACDRRAGGGRALEPKRCASQRNRKFGGRGHYQRTKNRATGLPEPGGRARSRGRASRPGPESLVRARLPHAAHARSKKRKRRPPEGHRQPRRRTGCTPETHALQNDTLRPEPAPAGMLQGLPIAAARRAAASSG